VILIVDDEPVFRTLVTEALRREGHELIVCSAAAEALERLEEYDPDLIISDIVMPGMDGFAFKEEYSKRFPERTTPFVFLSSQSAPEQIVKGLDSDVDDYLTKPIVPEVLRAKVRSLLSRSARHTPKTFTGDLALFPFIKIIRFCEQHGLTGEIDFETADWKITVPFKAGEISIDDLDDGDLALERLYDLENGRFTIRTGPVDFSSLENVEVGTDSCTTPSPPSPGLPMGRLSGIKAGKRLFQIQTELTTHPELRVITVVILDGNTVLKRATTPPENADRNQLETLIEDQHRGIETEVRTKIESLGQEKSRGDDHEFFGLLDEGFTAYRSGDFQRALEVWSKARTIKPDDPTLKVNMKIVRLKIEQGAS